MPWYRVNNAALGDTLMHIHFGGARARARAPRPCSAPYTWAHGAICGQMSAFQCDWKMGPGRTCDRYICGEHAHEVAPEKHLCPEHQAAYERWLANRGDPVHCAGDIKPAVTPGAKHEA